MPNLGFESKHNLDCWEQKEYFGFGAAAHSYIEGIRYSNCDSVESYINNINLGKFEDNIIIHERQNKEDMRKRVYDIGIKENRWSMYRKVQR